MNEFDKLIPTGAESGNACKTASGAETASLAAETHNPPPERGETQKPKRKLSDDFFALVKLAGRALKIFLLDKGAVLFSLLAPLILLLLYALFLGDVLFSSVSSALPPGVKLPDSTVKAFIDSWVTSGVMSVGCITVSLSANTVMVQDRERGFNRDALVSPVGGGVVTLGYFLYNFVVTLFICSVTLGVCFVYLAVSGSFLMTAADVFAVVGITALSCLSSTLVNVFISGFFRSNAAFSAFVGLVSAVIGFLIGAYMPLGILPGYVRALTCFFPGSYSASLFRCFFMRGALSALGGTSAEAYSSLASSYAVGFDFFGIPLGVGATAGILSGTVALFFVVNILRGAAAERLYDR